jgi:hypothetical protein
MQRSKRLAAATIAACGAIAAAAAGASAASASQPSMSGVSHIMVYSINSDGPYFQEIVTGAIGDYGSGKTVLPDGKLDPQHTSELELDMHHGTFRLNIATLDRDVVKAYKHWPSNKSTCSGSISFSTDVPVVAGSGTGAYRGITGNYTVNVTIDEVDVKPVCDGTSPFISQVILLNGTGNVSY